jgi:hypothetical protein
MWYSMFQAGADVNAGRPVTPLIVAAADGLADCIKCLLEAGADANIPDEVSFCALLRLLSVCLSNVASELAFFVKLVKQLSWSVRDEWLIVRHTIYTLYIIT